jgi:formylglycine-generating enzyme required for sulfatase activity
MQPSCAAGAGCQGGKIDPPAGAVAVSFDFEANGYGCVLQTTSPVDAELTAFLATMKAMTKNPLYTYDDTWRYLHQKRVDIPKTTPQSSAPAGTVHVPENKTWKFVVKGVEIEGDDGHGVDIQYPWEEQPGREHSHTLSVGPFYMDQYPVTATNYSDYIKATSYKPADPYRWLKNWNGSMTPPAAIASMPVTYVSLEEARAYCKWKGARLPHEEVGTALGTCAHCTLEL